MTLTATLSKPSAPPARGGVDAKLWLTRAGALWLIVALAGQMMFALYVIVVYGGRLLGGEIEAVDGIATQGYVPGDMLGNLMFGLHMMFTVVIIIGGALQLIPVLRRRLPTLHRWTGRTYVVSAGILSLGGIFLIAHGWAVGSILMKAATIGNGLVIVGCAAAVLIFARRRKFDSHRRWALRLFIAVSGVWFFRIMLMAWIMAFQGPVGFDPVTFTGPLLVTLNFAQYLLPLAVLELYLRVQDRGTAALRLGTAGLLFGLTLLTAGGIIAATISMWLPRM